MEKTIFIKKNIEVLIVSSGGVGTTFLMDAIGSYCQTNSTDNKDGYKHLPIPPVSFNPNLKVIYVFGDPILACVSLFRRRYHHTQSWCNSKFQNFDYIIPENKTLEEYADEGKEGLYFESHFNNWSNGSAQYPILFLKYSQIFDSLTILKDFLDLPYTFVQGFQKKKERLSKLSELSDETILSLKKMYRQHQELINRQPGSFVLAANERRNKILFNKVYRAAMKEAFFKKNPLLRKIKNKVFR